MDVNDDDDVIDEKKNIGWISPLFMKNGLKMKIYSILTNYDHK